MKLAVSNIAWDHPDEAHVRARLRACGVTGIEVAPTKLWPDWNGATPRAAEDAARRLRDEGFSVPAFQAILFGRPDLRLFDPGARKALLDHLRFVADLAVPMGAGVLVFGAPKNRRRGQLSLEEAHEIAVPLFRDMGRICDERGLRLGLEHNPPEYGCDFILNAADARRFVDHVDSPGVALHLDSGGLHLGGGDIGLVIRDIGPFCHYHASEPMLAPLGDTVVDHAGAVRALRDIGYDKWVSIEMSAPADPAFWDAPLEKMTGLLRESSIP